ncbi:hypothetical protein [Paenibacillus massiliensis]|uniref:hypothetical protein n=1 Tax=Paenibacillus massiliensis TaxID=225917 RepID=UPI0012EC2D42|nr:hypothetical protein [Paenibacillus massiliensis]
MAVRIKASDAFEDISALNLVGGTLVEGKYPKFAFPSQAHRQEYDRIRKQIKGGKTDAGQVESSNNKAGKPPVQYRTKVGLQRLE